MTSKPNEPIAQRHSARLSSNDESISLINTSKRTSKTVNIKINNSSSSLSLSMSASMSKRQHTNSSSNLAGHGHSRSKPAELYRTDFITAMKIPDTEVLDEENYFLIKDPWKMDWEKGVQVPVKPDSLYKPNFMHKPDQYSISYNNHVNNSISRVTRNSKSPDFTKMPKKYLCPTYDKKFDPQIHEAYLTHGILNDTSSTSALVCRYDCDDMDLCWLDRVNQEFMLMGLPKLTRVDLERLIENFEIQSHENFKRATDKLESYSIEYDEGIVCDVCHSPDSEDTNEMVFCDGCNMCVHQACYGISKIPQGNWLCVPCSFGGSSHKPDCILCPNIGGAMKATKNYRNWAHVSCALWIPEVGFGNAEKMEPIINLNQINAARWQLVCGICKEKRGCCLQCSEKRCHAAFHVSCAFKYNLEMQQQHSNTGDENEIVFKAYCKNHTKKRQMMHGNFNETSVGGDEEEANGGEEEHQHENETENTRKRKSKHLDDGKSITLFNKHKTSNTNHNSINNNNQEEADINDNSDNEDPEHNLSSLATMSETERKLEIIKRILKLKRQFYKNISLDQAQTILNIKTKLHVDLTFGYWKLKRRFNKQSITLCDNKLMPSFDKALIPPKGYETDLLNRSEHLMIARIKMFHNLRQSLEKLRTLSYMVIRREKLKKQLNETNQRLFEKQVDYLCKYSNQTVTPLYCTNANNSSDMINSTSSTPLTRRGRFSDKLQIKNEQCIYDFPELWLSNNTINNNSNNKLSDLDESLIETSKPSTSTEFTDSSQACTSSSVASSSSPISIKQESNLYHTEKFESKQSPKELDLEVSSTSNSNKENLTQNSTLNKNSSLKPIKNQSPKSLLEKTNNGKLLTNRIKNKYKNIGKKENRILNRLRNSKSKRTQNHTAFENVLTAEAVSHASQSTSIINQININIANIKKTNSLNLALIRGVGAGGGTSPQQDSNGKDKKLTNSTNLNLRNTSTRIQQQKQLSTNLSSPLKRLNGQNNRATDFLKSKNTLIKNGVSTNDSTINKRRRLTDTHLIANLNKTSSSTNGNGNIIESQLDLDINKSRTRFSRRINNNISTSILKANSNSNLNEQNITIKK